MDTTPVTRRNMVVIGGSYVGGKAVLDLMSAFGNKHNVVLVEKNSHFQHLFAFPRISAVPGFAQKAFVPFGFSPKTSGSRLVRGVAERITGTSVVLAGGEEIPYDYLIVATGTSGSSAFKGTEGQLIGTDKKTETEKFKALQAEVENAGKVAVVGGGAYGVQLAFDVKEYYPAKSVVLIHSRAQVMNRFDKALHDLVTSKFAKVGIETVLGHRVKTVRDGQDGKGKVVELMDGGEVQADCVISCTGSRPLSAPLLSLSPSAVDPATGFVRVKPTLQIHPSSAADPEYPNVFAIGDVADTGAHKAARPAFGQIEVAVANIRRLMRGRGEALEEYVVPPVSIHLALGLRESVKFRNPLRIGEGPGMSVANDGDLEMGCGKMWARRAPGVTDYEL
ncbi:FAD/NAD(P)-binding domain-containing protein [Hymenopellis radicata]|nr:FAD/NAD(P)-binding domain-containing protein [Hymenopellis radicata]